jgi:hypothetical protein
MGRRAGYGVDFLLPRPSGETAKPGLVLCGASLCGRSDIPGRTAGGGVMVAHEVRPNLAVSLIIIERQRSCESLPPGGSPVTLPANESGSAPSPGETSGPSSSPLVTPNTAGNARGIDGTAVPPAR